MSGCKSSGCDTAAKQKQEQDVAVSNTLERIKNKFIILSGKGGVGKTSTSVNLSIALADMGYKVGLMDVDIHGPDVPRMLGLTEMLGVSSEKKLLPLAYSDNLGVVSIESLSMNKDDAIIWRGPMKFSAIRQFLSEVAWGDLDFLLVDCPPGTGDEPLTIAQTIPNAQAIIVTTPQEVALADVRKSISFCRTLKMDVFGLVENMSGFACPHCNETITLFGAGGGEKTAYATGIQFLGKIPFDPNMVVCGDSGISFQREYQHSQVTKAYTEIAGYMAKLVEKQ